jgi:hypothetical protein
METPMWVNDSMRLHDLLLLDGVVGIPSVRFEPMRKKQAVETSWVRPRFLLKPHGFELKPHGFELKSHGFDLLKGADTCGFGRPQSCCKSVSDIDVRATAIRLAAFNCNSTQGHGCSCRVTHVPVGMAGLVYIIGQGTGWWMDSGPAGYRYQKKLPACSCSLFSKPHTAFVISHHWVWLPNSKTSLFVRWAIPGMHRSNGKRK